MKYLYDSDSNSLVVTFAEGRKYRDSEEIADGVVLDFDSEGRPVSIEFLRAKESVDVTGLVSGRPVRLAYGSYTGPETVTGEALKAWRENLGITPEQLATYLLVGVDTISAWERNDRPIEFPGLLRLALETVEGSLHQQFIRQVLRDFNESVQQYLADEAPRQPVAGGARRR